MAIKSVDAGPAVTAMMRGLIAGLAMLPFLRPHRITFSWKLAGLLVSYAMMNAFFITATKWTAAANAIALQYTAPLWIFAAVLVSGRLKLTLRRAAPMALVLIGITAFLLEPNQGTSFSGNLMGIASGIGFALTTVFLRALRKEHGPSLVCLANFAAAIALLPFVGDWGQIGRINAGGWAWLVYLGAFQIAGGYLLYAAGLRRVSSLKAATVALAEPVLNPVWVAIILAEVPGGYGMAGAIVILAGVALDLYLNSEENGEGIPGT